jgi:hypothetical protein
MQRLRESDGTPVHRRAARSHIRRCKKGTAPLHATLAVEMTAKLNALILQSRAVEDLEDEAVDADADMDAAELAFENVIRDLDADLAKVDRSDATLSAQVTTFPEGYGAVIDPEGAAQLAVLPTLKVRIKPFKDDPTIASALAKLDATTEIFKLTLKAVTAAEENVEVGFAIELSERAAIREQMESAYGRLRDLYKARPALAEAFFSKERGSRRAAKKTTPAATPAAATPATPAAATPATPAAATPA